MLELWPEERAAIRPPGKLSVAEWCNRNIVLLPESSREPGPFRWERCPYQRDILNLYKHPQVRQIVLKWATQIGKTQSLYNLLAYIIDQDPFSTLLVYATEDQAREISRTRLQPMIEASPALRAKKPAEPKLYQLTEMTFPGMILHLAGSNSPTPLSQKPVRCVLRDEICKWPKHIAGAGDPLELSAERFKAYHDIRKIIDVSSPTDESGNITKLERSCQVILKYFVPCPHCNALQTLEWEQIKFDRDEDLPKNDQISRAKQSAYYECLYCKAEIGDEQKDRMLANGGWYPVDEGNPEPSEDPIGDLFRDFEEKGVPLESIAARLSSLYSPWIRWADIVEKFLQAYLSDFQKFDKLRAFKTDWLGEEWKDTLSEKSETDILRHKCEYPPLIVPDQAVILTAGIDCQQDGFFFVIRAWAADSTSWLIRYGFLLSWSDIQNLIFQDSYQKANSDERMNLGRCAIDTGGGMDGDQSMTASAYDFLGRYTHQPIFGIKGASREMTSKMKLTIIKNFPGSKAATPGAVRLYVIDTVFFKDLFHSRFQIKEGDPGCIYLHSETGMDYASQIVSEEKRRDRYGRATWKHVRGQNHYLDAEVYCSCLVHHECYGGFQVLRAGNIRPKQQEQNRSVIPYRRKKGYERPNWLDR